MNKKIITGIIIIAAITLVFITMWKAKDSTVDESDINSQTTTTDNSAKTTDSDIKAIEDDLKAVDENNFNVDDISDENVGL